MYQELQFYEGNVAEFIDIILTLKNCKVHFLMAEAHDYLFTVKDLQMMAEKNIKVVYMSTICLNTDDLGSTLGHFVPVLKKLKYLDDIDFDGHCEDGPPPVHLFFDLPIIRITTDEFKLEKRKIKEKVNTISQIKASGPRESFFIK